ncbi:Hypothetical predicted protein [Olea europaea subsp. europaea]|uniref:Uncharacterized protein n=1 Tax=Olea europaea subsp. europaea TaxID=158383 RepID=A0A8S0RIV7_OLEEU|nr:Hypothetical predicted protein [Olea europaea subsp. europaea]
MGNISFSLFQFGGPAALLVRSKLDYDSLEKEIAGGISPDLSVNCGGISPNLSVNRHGGHDACREISPLLPKSCRFVPTCSEYSMIAYKKYGVAKGTILTAWRLCCCNPLGGSGFDPPRWFNEPSPPEQ